MYSSKIKCTPVHLIVFCGTREKNKAVSTINKELVVALCSYLQFSLARKLVAPLIATANWRFSILRHGDKKEGKKLGYRLQK